MKKILAVLLILTMLFSITACNDVKPAIEPDKTSSGAVELTGKTMYVLTLEVKQTHITLDVGQLLKDNFNKTEFEIPVDKDFYDEQEVGQEIVRKFRSGSLVFAGTIGDWVITVVDKKEVQI